MITIISLEWSMTMWHSDIIWENTTETNRSSSNPTNINNKCWLVIRTPSHHLQHHLHVFSLDILETFLFLQVWIQIKLPVFRRYFHRVLHIGHISQVTPTLWLIKPLTHSQINQSQGPKVGVFCYKINWVDETLDIIMCPTAKMYIFNRIDII